MQLYFVVLESYTWFLWKPVSATEKGYCDFLSHNSDIFFTELWDINSQLRVIKSELQDINSQYWLFFTELWDINSNLRVIKSEIWFIVTIANKSHCIKNKKGKCDLFFSQLWLFFPNCVIQTRNSDFFSSQFWPFFSELWVYISQLWLFNCNFMSCNWEFI